MKVMEQLRASRFQLRVAPVLIDGRLRIELLAHEVREPAARHSVVDAVSTAVSLAVVVDAKAPGDYCQPGGETRAAGGLIRPEPPSPVAAKLAHDMRIQIHPLVVLPLGTARHMEK